MKGDTFTLGELARRMTGGNLRTMAKILNDLAAGLELGARLDENEPDPMLQVSREAVILLRAERASELIGRRAGRLLDETGERGR